jgi:hypothetical protein
MVGVGETQSSANIPTKGGFLSGKEVEEERGLANKFRFGNVFTSEELQKIKKAIENYVNSKSSSGWAVAMLLGSMRSLLRNFEDRYCRSCWSNLKSALHIVGLEDPSILKKVEEVLKDPQLQFVERCHFETS